MNYIYGDIFELGTMLEYQKDLKIKNCLRKTMVIYAVSIIEALLLWKMNKKIKSGDMKLKHKTEIKEIASTSMRTSGGGTIIMAKKVKKIRKVEEIDFKRRIDLCERNIVLGKELIDKLHKARELRNKLHIDGLRKVRKNYYKRDLDFILDTLQEVERAIR